MFNSKVIITDNYFLLTSVLNKRKQTKCIQVWHANGSLKNLVWKTLQTCNGRKLILKGSKVYSSYDYLTVGSEEMANIFKKSFGIKDNQLLKIGVPLTDPYYRENKKKFQIL